MSKGLQFKGIDNEHIKKESYNVTSSEFVN